MSTTRHPGSSKSPEAPADMDVRHHIGLEIAEHSFRLVEMSTQDRRTTILRADIWETEHDYASHLLHEVPFEKNLARSFIASLSDLINSDAIFSTAVSLVLPVDLPVITTLPIDRGMTEEAKFEQLQWETRTLAGLPEKTQMHILTHRVGQTADAEKILVVALPQSTVDFLVTTFSYLTLDLASIDVDHFILEDWVRHSYGSDTQARIGVLGLYSRFCSAGVYTAGSYRGFRMRGFDSRRQYLAQTVQAFDELLRPDALPLDSVYAFGAEAIPGVAETLQGLLDAPVSRIIPLVNTNVSDEIRTTLDLYGEHHFDAAAGAALRGSR